MNRIAIILSVIAAASSGAGLSHYYWTPSAKPQAVTQASDLTPQLLSLQQEVSRLAAAQERLVTAQLAQTNALASVDNDLRRWEAERAAIRQRAAATERSLQDQAAAFEQAARRH